MGTQVSTNNLKRVMPKLWIIFYLSSYIYAHQEYNIRVRKKYTASVYISICISIQHKSTQEERTKSVHIHNILSISFWWPSVSVRQNMTAREARHKWLRSVVFVEGCGTVSDAENRSAADLVGVAGSNTCLSRRWLPGCSEKWRIKRIVMIWLAPC